MISSNLTCVPKTSDAASFASLLSMVAYQPLTEEISARCNRVCSAAERDRSGAAPLGLPSDGQPRPAVCVSQLVRVKGMRNQREIYSHSVFDHALLAAAHGGLEAYRVLRKPARGMDHVPIALMPCGSSVVVAHVPAVISQAADAVLARGHRLYFEVEGPLRCIRDPEDEDSPARNDSGTSTSASANSPRAREQGGSKGWMQVSSGSSSQPKSQPRGSSDTGTFGRQGTLMAARQLSIRMLRLTEPLMPLGDQISSINDDENNDGNDELVHQDGWRRHSYDGMAVPLSVFADDEEGVQALLQELGLRGVRLGPEGGVL